MRPRDGGEQSVYEVQVSWDGGPTTANRREVAWVVDEPILNGRHYTAVKTQPEYGPVPPIPAAEMMTAFALDALAFPYQIYAFLSYAGAHCAFATP